MWCSEPEDSHKKMYFSNDVQYDYILFIFATICLFLEYYFKMKIKTSSKVELRGVNVSVRWEKGVDLGKKSSVSLE